MSWLDDVYKMIQEDKKEHYSLLTMLVPLARTSLDAKSGRAMESYTKQVQKNLENLTPWETSSKKSRLSDLRRKVKSGTVVVIPDASDDPNSPLFKDAKLLKG